ncbi:MAG: hypothetical protein ACP5JG_08705 [Anaerolineae bacterium]
MSTQRSLTRWGRIVIIALLSLCLGSAPVRAQTPGTIGVYYVGPEDAVAEAINIAAPHLVRVDQPDLAQVFVINNAPLRESLPYFSQEVQEGRVGLVLFSGALFPQSLEDMRAVLGVSAFNMSQIGEGDDVRPSTIADPLHRGINWNSAPEVKARTVITNPNLLRPIVVTLGQQAVVQRVRGRQDTQALIVGPWFNHPTNDPWISWAYFDYMVYRLVADAAGTPRPLSFMNYPNSPAPHRRERWAITGLGFGLLLSAGVVYYLARRRLYLRPKLAASWRRLTATSTERASAPGWNEVGFHRPLAGFFAYMPAGLLLFIPLLAYRVYLLPQVLLPGSQGYEAWTLVSRWTLAFWILLDAGTDLAAVRFFSARQTHFPRQAPRYIQFYVWWQFLSGAGQLGLICLLIAVGAPNSGQAHLAYYLLARAILQFPGFLRLFGVAFRARQRFDYEQYLNLLYLLGTLVLQTGLVLLFRKWGATQNDVGPGLGSVLGLAGGLYLGEGLIFGAGLLLYRRQGLPISALFLPTFDRRTTRDMLGFGIPWAVAATVPALSLVIEPVLYDSLSERLALSYQDWRLIFQVMAGYDILSVGLFQSLVPTLTEVIALDYRTLLKYYVSRGIQYGAWFSFFFFAAVSAIGAKIITGSLGTAYDPALPWLIPMLAWGGLRWASWLPDRMLEAAGRPGLMIPLTLIEHVVRLGGSLVLTVLWGTQGLVIAYIVALGIRIAVARFIVGRVVVRARIYTWQALIAPAVAALFIYELLRIFSAVWRLPSPGATLLVGAITLPISFLIYAFVTALLGGWDDNSLSELRKAVQMSGIGYPLAFLLLLALRAGAYISPLHGRFGIGLYDMAQEEARSLTFAQTAAAQRIEDARYPPPASVD